MGISIENVRLDTGLSTLRLEGRQVAYLGGSRRSGDPSVDGRGYWLLPGLINAHDHLHLDLLPRLGNPPYPNSRAWGLDVYHPDRPPIREIWRLPLRERLLWGAYRNLLSGVTTVQHHDRWHWRLAWLPVRVPPYRWLHRPGSRLGGHWHPGKPAPLFVHCAEGTDEDSAQEVAVLAKLGLLGQQTVLVHGIALSELDIERIGAAGAGVVICPQSNLFLYGRTAPVEGLLAAGIPLALGTDSTASGSTDLLEELRNLRGRIPEAQLLDMVGAGAARLLGVPRLGRLAVGAPADLILLDRPEATSAVGALLSARPWHVRLVILAGRPVLVCDEFAAVLGDRLQKLLIDGSPVWLAGPIAPLLAKTRKLLGERRFFGRRIELEAGG